MKTIILNASPRKNWNTAQLLKSAAKGAESAGAEVEYINCKSKTANIKLRKGTVYMDKSKIKRLADYAVRQCCDNSENCYWSVSYYELYHHFGVEITDSNESAKLLEKELRQREEINELIMTEDAIEMTCHLRYCPQCQSDPLSLFSVLGCNLYDDHETEHNHEPANESSDEDETQALSM